MTHRPHRLLALAALALWGTSLSWGQPSAERLYRVSVENLTSGQALTGPLVVTHGPETTVFSVGAPAGPSLQALAENGDTSGLVADLQGRPDVASLELAGGGPLVPVGDPGQTGFSAVTHVMVSARDDTDLVSIAAMLICTNDGFTGLSGLPLPRTGAEVVLTAAMDAGTEQNTENYEDLVPPCQGLFGVDAGVAGTGASNPLLAEGGVVTHHPGILGNGQLDAAVHDWQNPVARVTLTRLDARAQRFEVRLTGAAEVPTVASFGTGEGSFELCCLEQQLSYRLDVRQLSGVTAVHLHHGLPGENGPVVATLLTTPATGLVHGTLANGTLSESDLAGPFAGDMAACVEALRQGELYVNVHTADVPSGELRGQVGAVGIGE